MTIGLAVDKESEATWWVLYGLVYSCHKVMYSFCIRFLNASHFFRKIILSEGRANVETETSIQKTKGSVSVDCWLFNSVELPPQVISPPIYVSKVISYICDDVPLLDLAWAHQCIIQRKHLPLVGDERYSVLLVDSLSTKVFSLRSRSKIRYEVGNLVQFSWGPKTASRGRILKIIWGRHDKSFQLEVQLLVSPFLILCTFFRHLFHTLCFLNP